ncbi:hypothetical protein [Ottowia sp. VDI28]|uniref:hypothetical protein n=1 Tax=Ottowia sp. VDI28 TaxID=3133968 RepID=UPI003C2DA112
MTGTSPRIVCVACSVREVGAYELLCADCIQVAEQIGLIDPTPTTTPDQLTQIGPTDI